MRETLMHDLAEIDGLSSGAIHPVGEATLKHFKTRPDFAVTVHEAPAGFVETMAPGKAIQTAILFSGPQLTRTKRERRLAAISDGWTTS